MQACPALCRSGNGSLESAREALADPQAEVHLQVGGTRVRRFSCCDALHIAGAFLNPERLEPNLSNAAEILALLPDSKGRPGYRFSFCSHFVLLFSLQVADLEPSQADHCKLYIHTKLNNITYRLKAETACAPAPLSALCMLHRLSAQLAWDECACRAWLCCRR